MSQPDSALSLLNRINGVFPIARGGGGGGQRGVSCEEWDGKPPTKPPTVPWTFDTRRQYGLAASAAVVYARRRPKRNIVDFFLGVEWRAEVKMEVEVWRGWFRSPLSQTAIGRTAGEQQEERSRNNRRTEDEQQNSRIEQNRTEQNRAEKLPARLCSGVRSDPIRLD